MIMVNRFLSSKTTNAFTMVCVWSKTYIEQPVVCHTLSKKVSSAVSFNQPLKKCFGMIGFRFRICGDSSTQSVTGLQEFNYRVVSVSRQQMSWQLWSESKCFYCILL